MPSDIIEIEGGLVRTVRREVSAAIPLSDWLPRVERRLPVDSPVLPTGTRKYWWDPRIQTAQRLIVLIERDPHVATITFNNRIMRLQMPFTRFMFALNTTNPDDPLTWMLTDHRVFWSRTRFNNPAATDMIPALLPNVYRDGRICFGSTGARADQALDLRLDQTVNEFYISQFNRDLDVHLPNNWTTWTPWAKMTKNDPTAWLTWPDLRIDDIKHNHFSWNALATLFGAGQLDRMTPIISADGIPPVPMNATFGRVAEWIETLNPLQRERLRGAINGTPIASIEAIADATAATIENNGDGILDHNATEDDDIFTIDDAQP